MLMLIPLVVMKSAFEGESLYSFCTSFAGLRPGAKLTDQRPRRFTKSCVRVTGRINQQILFASQLGSIHALFLH